MLIGAVDCNNEDESDEDLGVTPCLPVHLLYNDSGSFVFNAFPDTGSGTCIISSDLVEKYDLQLLKKRNNVSFITVNGKRLSISGKVFLTVDVNSMRKCVCFFVCKDIRNEVLIGYKALKWLKINSKDYPIAAMLPCSAILGTEKEKSFNEMASSLMKCIIKTFPAVLSGILPKSGMRGEKIKIHLNDWPDV